MVQGEKGHQLNKSKSLRGLTKDGFFLHGTPYPTDTHTPQDPLRVEELLEKREQWMGNGMNFFPDFL